MKLKFKSALLAALLLPALAGSALAQIKDRTIKIGTGIADDNPQVIALRRFAQTVGTKSGGKLQVKVFSNGTLGNDVTMIAALRGGTLEMTIPDSSTLVSIVKDFGVINLPYTFRNEREADAVLDGAFGKKLLAKLPEKGLVGLTYFENGFRNVTNSRRPITKPEDLQGLKLRVIQNPLFVDSFATLGANATPLPFTELYSAMEQKAVDGQENPTVTILTSKFYEVQKHMVLSRHIYGVWPLLMSKKLWDTLSADERKIVQESANEAAVFQRREMRALSERAVAELKKLGMQVTELSAADQNRMRDKLQPVIAKYTKEFGEESAREMLAEIEKVRK